MAKKVYFYFEDYTFFWMYSEILIFFFLILILFHLEDLSQDIFFFYDLSSIFRKKSICVRVRKHYGFFYIKCVKCQEHKLLIINRQLNQPISHFFLRQSTRWFVTCVNWWPKLPCIPDPIRFFLSENISFSIVDSIKQ